MHFGLHDIVYLILVPAIIKAVIELFKLMFVKTEKDAIAWIHFKYRAMRRGHKAKHPRDCVDGACLKV